MIAATVRTPTPVPTPAPIPAFFPVSEWEAGAVDVGIKLKAEVGPESELKVKPADIAEDAVSDLLVVELETPTVSASMIRSLMFIAQHASEVKPLPQHQLPSVEHCNIANVPFDRPSVCYFVSAFSPVKTHALDLRKNPYKLANRRGFSTKDLYMTHASTALHLRNRRRFCFYKGCGRARLEGNYLRWYCAGLLHNTWRLHRR